MKKQTSPPNRRGRLVLLCFVLGLILIVMLVGTVYLQHLLGRIHYVDSGTAPTLSPEELDAYLATQPEEINTAPTMDPEDVTFPDYDADIGRDSNIINILLIGQDLPQIRKETDHDFLPPGYLCQNPQLRPEPDQCGLRRRRNAPSE